MNCFRERLASSVIGLCAGGREEAILDAQTVDCLRKWLIQRPVKQFRGSLEATELPCIDCLRQSSRMRGCLHDSPG